MVDMEECHLIELFSQNEEKSVTKLKQLGDIKPPQGIGYL